MNLLDGKIVRDAIRDNLKNEIEKFSKKPHLVIFQVGEKPESSAYIAQKIKFGESVGASVTLKKFDELVGEGDLRDEIIKSNNDSTVHGMILQLPLPPHLNPSRIISAIDPAKDVDGLTPTNIKKLLENDKSGMMPATARAVLRLLDHYRIKITGKRVVVVGRSTLVGKPCALAFLGRDATVTVCHSQTADLASETKRTDILVVAAGKPNLISVPHVTKDQVVVDVGINLANEHLDEEIPGKKFVGDVDFESVKDIVGSISPVPGGVGPLTVASLFENLLQAFKNFEKK